MSGRWVNSTHEKKKRMVEGREREMKMTNLQNFPHPPSIVPGEPNIIGENNNVCIGRAGDKKVC